MRLITVKTPQGAGRQVAQVAFAGGAEQVSIRQESRYTAQGQETVLDVVDVETATPVMKQIVEQLMAAPIYDPATWSFTIRHPESLFATKPPKVETHPIVRPTPDVYQELWQFTKVTVSLVGRVFFSAVLLSFGMVKDSLPLIIAGLLFLPYHHHMLAVGLGAVLREWQFLGQGLLALLVTTALIVLGGACVALFLEPPVGFDKFGSPLEGAILGAVIGAAAALGASDDAGRRELIGLAATAHISVYPAWFGLHLVYGFAGAHKTQEHLLAFAAGITALTAAAALVFALMGMRGDGIRRFVKQKSGIE